MHDVSTLAEQKFWQGEIDAGRSSFGERLQISGIILILGLFTQGFCLLGHRPIAFLLALVRAGHDKAKPDNQ